MLRSKLFFVLAISMAGLVAISNFLVQFPVNYFEMDSILTYAAFTYPITFLITDLANRKYGKFIARKIVYLGFFTGVLLTLYFSTNFKDLISIRIAIGSGVAFLIAQLLDVNIFDMTDAGKLIIHFYNIIFVQLNVIIFFIRNIDYIIHKHYITPHVFIFLEILINVFHSVIFYPPCDGNIF